MAVEQKPQIPVNLPTISSHWETKLRMVSRPSRLRSVLATELIWLASVARDGQALMPERHGRSFPRQNHKFCFAK
jgi:hypothetical protein